VETKERVTNFWIGENRVYLRDDDIIQFTIVGDQDEKTVICLKEASNKLKSMVGGRPNVLVDLNRVGKPTQGARRIGKERLDDDRVGKVALFGLHPVARVIASFVISVTRKKDMRFFKTKEEALLWLRDENTEWKVS
jgi:hypothetical protein